MKKNNIKKVLLLALITLILTCSIGGTIAFLIDDTDPVTNTFKPTTMSSTVEEKFDGKKKENVTIKNTSTDVDAYVRAAIVITWQDEKGNIYPVSPVKDQDYTISLNEGTGATAWTKNGNYYYYNSVVKAGSSTENLIISCSPKDTTPVGYGLVVEILSSTIQAVPTTAVSSAWGFVPGSSN